MTETEPAVGAEQVVPGMATIVGVCREKARRLAERARTAARGTARAWRHSLQLRVGTTTVLVTGAVVLVIGILLVDQVSGGILRAKKQAAVSQAKIGLASAASVLAAVDAGVPGDVETAQLLIKQDLTARGNSAGLFTIAIESASSDSTDPGTATPIPTGLRKLVQQNNLALQYAPVRTTLGGALVPGLIVGEPVQARTGLFELYYLFPLTNEEQTIALVQRTVLLSGLALVLLVLGIALLVTRQVVRPVRVAAQTAGRLAAGDLSQRIKVHGTDDIARLGQSFNDMAGSLQRQIRRLEDLSRLQRRFTSDVSHELRTPLTTIRMASELLHANRGEFPPELGRSAELLHTQLDRFEALLGDLLEISRYDAGVARLESETADLRSLVRSTVEANRVLAERHGSEIIVTEPVESVDVDMDARRVERIIRNLLGNALDHGEGKPIEITIAFDDDCAAVTVRDHGVGLRPGEAGLVFNRFWRGDPSRSRLTGGTGLGLAISLEDARLHDGWLQAWGERGRGAQFRLTLPRLAGHTLASSPLPLNPDDSDDGHSDVAL
ncbi:MAG TPA: MtrAB system histidine kinase MtrB, partial [Humibacter sp.]|nr:MtrAB system histidine kinase MtrB [Humibacter sp.]